MKECEVEQDSYKVTANFKQNEKDHCLADQNSRETFRFSFEFKLFKEAQRKRIKFRVDWIAADWSETDFAILKQFQNF